MIRLDPAEVEAARQGDRAALDGVVRAAEKPVFNLAMRMLAHRADAEGATQEILIKLITNLGGLREPEAAGGWAMRIACRHLVNRRKRSRVEAMRLSFDAFAADLEKGLDPQPPDDLQAAEVAVAMEQVKIGCTLAMLTCLSRKLRIAYLLGDILELTDKEAASALETTPAAYRQRLRRSRAVVTDFVVHHCGNASLSAACLCEKRISAAMQSGRISQDHTQCRGTGTDRKTIPMLRAEIRRLEESRRTAALLRSNPDFSSNVAQLVLSTLGPAREG
jgi:RNA polymerase sigma factor (sigma-70 family)